jgi:hypothetical protein
MTSWRPFLVFTALTLPACVLLILWLDKPLALAFHQYAVGAVPFFTSLTDVVDTAYAAANIKGRPTLFWALGLAYLVGRWGLRRRWATVFLITLLTHLASVVRLHGVIFVSVEPHGHLLELVFATGSSLAAVAVAAVGRAHPRCLGPASAGGALCERYMGGHLAGGRLDYPFWPVAPLGQPPIAGPLTRLGCQNSGLPTVFPASTFTLRRV